ncbi:MAG: hypothetical protein PHU21_09335, partial [Elusimicrobia bacterium]|nr:hypothetical protein [Elusimicrobiota bacterium]
MTIDRPRRLIGLLLLSSLLSIPPASAGVAKTAVVKTGPASVVGPVGLGLGSSSLGSPSVTLSGAKLVPGLSAISPAPA